MMPPGVSPLPAEGGTHLWRLRIDVEAAGLARLAESLSADEHRRARRLRFGRDRHRYVAGRGRLREVLATYVDTAPAQVVFAYGPRGKPRLGGLRACDLRFSLSHTGDDALIAITRGREVGVDLESIRPELLGETEASLFLSPSERRLIDRLPAAERTRALFTLWVQKEAYAKALGDGLALDLQAIEISACSGWDVRTLDAGPGFAAALAVERGLGPHGRRSRGQVTTIRDERRPGHEGGVVRREEEHRARDLHRLRHAPQRVHLC
jgi:4'-phosphopantetheinyl transferase